MKLISILALALGAAFAQAQTTINAVYFGQTHVLKASDPYFGLVGSREALIKVHVTDPAAPVSPAVSATLTLSGQTLVLPLTGPATLPVSIPDGLGVVQHSYANSFTAIIPAAWVKKGLQITVNAGAASTSLTNLEIGAPTKVVMTMFDVQYFADTTGNYPTNTFAELEAKWPVADLEIRRLGHIVFPELVIPPRADVGTKAVRIKSKAEYQAQTGLSFDGEQSAALAWNGALKRAAGRSGRWSLYYLNVYNAFAGGQAGGFAGVGSGTSVGILHHELGHALSLPHWGDSAAYPYKGDMHGIQAPSNYNETHAGPAWAFHLPTRAFIPPTVQAGNAGGKPVGTYKVDPMQGGGTGWQEPAYLMNHFSDYSVNQMRDYLQGHVVVWSSALNSWAQWNQTAGDYTTTVSNNGVQFPTTRDTQVISILASVSGSNPGINMAYPPIGPYTSGLIRLFDPTVAADRTSAQSIFSPTNGSDYCVRVVQGGVTKTYMLAASNLSTADPFAESSLITEAINLPAVDGAVTKIELLSTPNAEDVGLPANPTVLYTWAPLMPEPGTFDSPPTANSSSAITMTALPGEVAFGFTGGTVEYLFTETSGNPGATDSAWQTSRSYTDTGLQAGTTYSYTVSIRAGTLATSASAPASATTPAASFAGTITVNATEPFTLQSGSGYKAATNLGTFDAATADKLVVVIAAENANNDHFAIFGVRYNGVQMIEAVQQTGVTADGALAIYYLDNPGPVGTGITVSGYNPNGGLGTAYALSGTRPGYGAFNSRKGSSVTSVPITTSAINSIVIAALENSGNGNSAGTPTANSPLIQTHSANWGSQWGSLASGHIQVATPSTVTPTFTTSTGTSYNINIAAVEFLAEVIPGGTWVQTAGGAQDWTTGANWILGSAPSPLAGDTVDFSTVNIAANTTLSLGANRTGGLWKFGDTAGTETWTVSSGSTITLAGTTPTMEVVNNSAQLDCLVAGTAGLAKTGAGTLSLSASNTYTGVTRISAGTLQAAILANGSSNSSIGASSNAATNLILNGGTLEYTGAAVSTNRLFSLQASSTIDASGTGAVNFTSTGSMGFSSSTAAKTLTLDGANTGANTLAAIIGDNTGATSITKSGAGTWVLSAANTYTGATTISGGTLRLANAAAVSGSGLVAIGGNTLHLATNTAFSGPPITMQAGTIVSDRATAGAGLTHVLGDAVIGNGLSNFTAGSNVTSGIAAIQLGNITNNNGSTATPGLNPTTANLIITGNVTLGTSNTGTANLTLGGTASVNSIGGIIENGTRATGNVIKSGTSTWTLSGLSATAASNYNGSTTIDNGTLRFITTSPSLSGGLTFGSAAGGTNVGTFDLSSASATFGGAFLARTDSATANAVSIGSGRTLQLSGSVTVGYNSPANSTTKLNVTGLGTLSIGTSGAPTNANLQIGNGATTQISNAGTLDLSGLSTFYSNLGTGTFRIGSPTNSGGVSAGGSTVILAANSTIQADKLLLASPDASSSTQSLKLGSGTNVIHVNTIHITGTGDLFPITNGRSTGSLTFNGASGSLTLRGLAGGTSRCDLNAGWSNMNTANGPTGTFNTTGHPADLRIGTMTLGRRTTNATSGLVSGVFNFDQGTLDADNLIVALAEVGGGSSGTVSLGGGSSTFNNLTNPIRLGENTTGSGVATGTLNISGLAIVNVAASGGTSIRLGHATAAGGTATGNLNLTGGTLAVAGDILRGSSTGTSNATVKLSGGTLNMGGHDLGAAGSGALTFTAESGTLQNVASINGTGGLTKTTAGTLMLQGTNTYTGNTMVTAGTLALAENARLNFVIGTTSGTNNRITGAGTVTLNGDFNIDTSLTDVSPLTSGSWTIVDAATLTETFGTTFTLTGPGWTEASNVWTKTVGSKKYTFTEATGILTLDPATSYASWINGFFPGETNLSIIGADADPDSDSIENGVEMVIGGNPKLGMDTALLPTLELVTNPIGSPAIAAGNYLLFTYRRSDLSVAAGVTADCETNTALIAPWSPATGAPGVVVQIDDNFTFTPPAAAATDRVRVYVPRGVNPKLFARMKVLVP